MIILGIETSCDETSAAILQKEGDGVTILSNIIASSADLQVKYGGIVPEQAAREQVKAIVPVLEEALSQAKITHSEIDAIAVTQGPGLIGSLLVGVETAKVLAIIWNKPLIPVNHLIGHFYANWIDNGNQIPAFPCIGLLVSGGHSDIVIFKDHGVYDYLGGTRDDAAGECFDKCARLLGYEYPGGPKISKLAEEGDPTKFNLPRPLYTSDDYDFSFSGLKTAFSNLLASIDMESSKVNDLCASVEQAIIDSLIHKVIRAAKQHSINQIIVAGGVAANKKLITQLTQQFSGKVLSPPPILCTDNAAMIASAAFYSYIRIKPPDLQANPNLSLQ